MKIQRILISAGVVIVLALLGLWGYWNFLAPQPAAPAQAAPAQQGGELPSVVSAEGKVTPASQASLGFPQGGRVTEVLVALGQSVKKGDPLVRLESETLQAALRQAEAGADAARVNLQAANTQLENAISAAHRQEAANRTTAWRKDPLSPIDKPVWYFDQEQEIAAAQTELEAARAALEMEGATLQTVQQKATSADLLAAEKRLAEAQAAFLVADQVLDRAQLSPDQELEDQAQEAYDRAKNELEAAQATYDQILTTQGAEDVLEARARLAVANERYEAALDRLYGLQTGDYSPPVKAAQQAVQQAQAALKQAEAAVEAAQVALDQAILVAPMDGSVVKLDVDPGDVVGPGLPLVVLADLSAWKVETTDLAESSVAGLEVGMETAITLDAFPDQTFTGTIREIGFVGEDRRGDVTYTVVVDFDPAGAPVRWGMTAFVEIILE